MRSIVTVAAGAMAVLISFFALGPPAAAKPCGMRSKIVRELSENLVEKRLGMGLTNAGALLELFVSKGGTWTIVVSTPKGWGCVFAAGDYWLQVPESPKPVA
jgi:hypothetical protein